jgi:glyoxylate/hydroxypyruvate reductase
MVWPKDTSCDRDWLLQNAVGATALIVLVNNKVCFSENEL